MQPSISNLFDPYNLYAKAFPGITFYILFLTILPRDSLSGITDSGLLLATLVILIIVLGYVFGQAIHSISVIIESSVYSTLSDYYYILSRIHNFIFGSEDDPDNLAKELTPLEKIRLVTYPIIVIGYTITTRDPYLLIGALSGVIWVIVAPIETAKRWVRSSLTPHRDQFSDRLDQGGPVVESFVNQANKKFNWTSRNDSEALYTSTMSYLEFIPAGRARIFQAIFSFCRSMWVILAFYAVVYLTISTKFDPPAYIPEMISTRLLLISDYQPAISSIIGSDTGMMIVGVAMIIAGFLFFRSEAQYKELFTQYLMLDFLTTTSETIVT